MKTKTEKVPMFLRLERETAAMLREYAEKEKRSITNAAEKILTLTLNATKEAKEKTCKS